MRRPVVLAALVGAAAATFTPVRLAVLGADDEPRARVIKVRYTPQDRAAGRYQYVPFDVPAGTTRLAFGYEYDGANGGNVVDLGLFDPGPLDLGTSAFRGWSGGARKRVTIGETEA